MIGENNKKGQQSKQFAVSSGKSGKSRQGRWTPAEKYYFESLLEALGKNWQKIHSYMPNRSLSQIRSHAQKYFDKSGKKKLEESQRKADLLKALETIEKAKQFKPQIFQPVLAQPIEYNSKQMIVKVQQIEKENLDGDSLKGDLRELHQIKKEKIVQNDEEKFSIKQNLMLNPSFSLMQVGMTFIPFTVCQYLSFVNLYPIQTRQFSPIIKIQAQTSNNPMEEVK